MIKATDLRIGNKFNGAGMVQTVKEILDYGPEGSLQLMNETSIPVKFGYEHLILVQENKNQYKPIEIEGIPLTADVLKCSGFIPSALGPDILEHSKWDRFRLDVNNGRVFIWETVYTGRVINYYHTLQNLFYFMTGEELYQISKS
jgi:hypothetical protein